MPVAVARAHGYNGVSMKCRRCNNQVGVDGLPKAGRCCERKVDFPSENLAEVVVAAAVAANNTTCVNGVNNQFLVGVAVGAGVEVGECSRSDFLDVGNYCAAVRISEDRAQDQVARIRGANAQVAEAAHWHWAC